MSKRLPISLKKQEKFGKLLTELFRQYGLECRPVIARQGYINTKYGMLEINGFDAIGGYTLLTCFVDPSKLPGEQVPYRFATADSHQTFSRGGHIGGNPFNGYSGKWNFHISPRYSAEQAFEIIASALKEIT